LVCVKKLKQSLIYYIKQIADLLMFSLSMTFKLLDSSICLFVTFCTGLQRGRFGWGWAWHRW